MDMTHEQVTDKIIVNCDFHGDKVDRSAVYSEFENNAKATMFVNIDDPRFHSYLRIMAMKVAPKFTGFNSQRAVTYIRDWFNMGAELENVDVFVRTAGNLKDGIVYDLMDKKQQVVVISKDGWEVTTEKPCKFLSSSTSLSQVMPEKTDEDIRDLLKEFFNLKGDDFILAILWLIQGFCNTKHFILLVRATRGSGKSTMCRILVQCLDPTALDITVMPSKKDDLQTILSNTYLACFDNVGSDMKKEISDLLCIATTGGTASKRTLYTDSGLTIQRLRNNLIINGLDVVPKEADLAERMLMVNLEKIEQSQMVRESDYMEAFEKARPKILGAIFNTLSKAMKIRKERKITDMPRMSDSFSDMLCLSLALGYTEEEFRDLYARNVEKMNTARANKPIVEAINEFMSGINGRKVEGTVSEIYTQVKEGYSGKRSLLPNSPSRFSRELEHEHDTLLAIGYRVNFDDTGTSGTKMQIIKCKS